MYWVLTACQALCSLLYKQYWINPPITRYPLEWGLTFPSFPMWGNRLWEVEELAKDCITRNKQSSDLNWGLSNLSADSLHFSVCLTSPVLPRFFHTMPCVENVSACLYGILGKVAEAAHSWRQLTWRFWAPSRSPHTPPMWSQRKEGVGTQSYCSGVCGGTPVGRLFHTAGCHWEVGGERGMPSLAVSLCLLLPWSSQARRESGRVMCSQFCYAPRSLLLFHLL